MATSPQCVSYSQADLNAGLICQLVPNSPNDYRYVATENWEKRRFSWGELKASMDLAVELNPSFAYSARRSVWYNCPSWHFALGVTGTNVEAVLNGNYGAVTFADSFIPATVADVWIAHWANLLGRDLSEAEKQDIRNDVDAGATPALDGVTGVNPSEQTQVYIVDPATGTKINTTNVSDPNAPVTPDGRSISQIVYGDRAPETQVATDAGPPMVLTATAKPDDDLVGSTGFLEPASTRVALPMGTASAVTAPAPSSSSLPPWWVFAGVGLAVIVALSGGRK